MNDAGNAFDSLALYHRQGASSKLKGSGYEVGRDLWYAKLSP